MKDCENEGEQERTRKKQDNTGEMQEAASGSQDLAGYEEMSIHAVEGMDLWEHLEKIPKKDGIAKIWDHSDDEHLKTPEDRDDGGFDDEYASDDVHDIALPLDMVKNARKEEIDHMKGKMLKVVKKGGGLECDRQGPDQHQVGGYRQDLRHWDSKGEVKVGGP